MSPAAPADHAAIAASLAQLTSGWTPTPGISPDTLTAAREALVASLLAGHSASDLHIVQPAVRADAAAEPRLAAELGAIATRIAAGPRPATTEEFGHLIVDETEKWAKVIKFAGLKPE